MRAVFVESTNLNSLAVTFTVVAVELRAGERNDDEQRALRRPRPPPSMETVRFMNLLTVVDPVAHENT